MAEAELLDEVDSGVTQPDENGDPVSIMVPAHAAVRVTSPMRLDQFAVELATLAQVPLTVVLLQASGSLDTADEDHPVALWTESEMVQPNVLLAAATAHTPDPTWQPTGASAGMTIEELRAKVGSGSMLSPEEVQLAVKFLLLEGQA